MTVPEGIVRRLYRIGVDEYLAMFHHIREERIVRKASKSPAHVFARGTLLDLFLRADIGDRTAWCQATITTPDSVPDPDVCVALGDMRAYLRADRPPTAAEVPLVIEVADTTLAVDRRDKGRIYARGGTPEYWVVNTVESIIEVYTDPDVEADEPAYGGRRDYRKGDELSMVFDGVEAMIAGSPSCSHDTGGRTMTVATPTAPPLPAAAPPTTPTPYLFSVVQFRQMCRGGVFGNDRVELLEGVPVKKMGINEPHACTTDTLMDILHPALPAGWVLRMGNPVETTTSEPQPDLAVVRGPRRRYRAADNAPTAADIAFVIEVADSALAVDRVVKGRVYAGGDVKEYWVVNIPDAQVEVYTSPDPDATPPLYRDRRDYRAGDEVPLTLDGVEVLRVRVAELFA